MTEDQPEKRRSYLQELKQARWEDWGTSPQKPHEKPSGAPSGGSGEVPRGETGIDGVVTPLRPVANPDKWAQTALEQELNTLRAAPVGRRNQTLNRCAFSLLQIVAEGYLDENQVLAQLTDLAISRGLSEKETANTLESAREAATQKPRGLPPPPPGESQQAHSRGPGEADQEQAQESDPAPDPSPLINPALDWVDLFTGDPPEEEWIINPLLPARRMVALYSAPKVGKSLLMLELAVAAATGGTALGVDVPAPHRVLYVDFENDPYGDIRTRLEAMGYGPSDLDNLCYLSFPTLAKMDTVQGGMDLINHVEHYDCDVVVIDTISRAINGEENDNDTWLAFHRNTGLTLKQKGVACIRLDHSGKDREKGMRGGSAKYGDVDAVWKLERITEATLTLECTDHRMPLETQALTLVRDPWPVMRHRLLAGDPAMQATEARVGDLVAVMDRLNIPDDTSNQACAIRLREAGHGARNADIRQAQNLRRLRLQEAPADEPLSYPDGADGPVIPDPREGS